MCIRDRDQRGPAQVSPIKISSRPVMRLHPGAPGWVQQLKQIESLGGRVEVF